MDEIKLINTVSYDCERIAFSKLGTLKAMNEKRAIINNFLFDILK